MKKVFLVIVMVLVSVLAKAECVENVNVEQPVRETIGSIR